MENFDEYMKWPQHKIDALFKDIFGDDYHMEYNFEQETNKMTFSELTKLLEDINEEISMREVEESDDIYEMCEDKTYMAKEMLSSIGIDV